MSAVRLLLATLVIYSLVNLCFGETETKATMTIKFDASENSDIISSENTDLASENTDILTSENTDIITNEPQSIVKFEPMQMLAVKGDLRKRKKKKRGKKQKKGYDGLKTTVRGKMDVFPHPGVSTTPFPGYDGPVGNQTTTTRKPKECRGIKCKAMKPSTKLLTEVKATTKLVIVNVTEQPPTPFYVFDGVDYEDDELFAAESKDCEGRYTTCAVDSERVYPVCGYLTIPKPPRIRKNKKKKRKKKKKKKNRLKKPYYMFQSLCDLEYHNCQYRYYSNKTGYEGTGISNNLYEVAAIDNCRRVKKAGYGILEWPYDIP